MNCVKYYVSINNIEINIIVENNFYQNYKYVFDKIFIAFEIEEYYYTKENNLPALFICNNENIDINSEKIFCNTKEKQWIHDLITKLEVYLINIMHITVLHAASLIYENKTFVIIGKRMSGKSSLVEYMLQKKQSYFIDDDCTFYNGKTIFGFNFPIRMRKLPLNTNNIFATTVDDQDEIRYLVNFKQNKKESNQNVIIIFPQYNKSKNYINSISGKHLFLELLSNTRYAVNNKIRLENLSEIANISNAYLLSYTSFEEVEKQINQIINEL